ncbi:hypothetical protein B484DRAFT_404076, partial [Ochromonadaceae sp. CCMP2298]
MDELNPTNAINPTDPDTTGSPTSSGPVTASSSGSTSSPGSGSVPGSGLGRLFPVGDEKEGEGGGEEGDTFSLSPGEEDGMGVGMSGFSGRRSAGRRGSVADRFEQAKAIQAWQQEQKIQQIQASRLPNAPPALRRGSVAAAWQDAVSATLKQVHANAHEQERVGRLSNDLNMDGDAEGDGDENVNVQRRRGELEIFVEIATLEQHEGAMAARMLSQRSGSFTGSGSSSGSATVSPAASADASGSTPASGSSSSFASVFASIQRLEEGRDKQGNIIVSLCCGVYGSSDHDKPPIDLFAAALRTEKDDVYIALTIKASPGQAENPLIYGVKKVAVFATHKAKEVIFETVVNIVPGGAIPGIVPLAAETETAAADAAAAAADVTAEIWGAAATEAEAEAGAGAEAGAEAVVAVLVFEVTGELALDVAVDAAVSSKARYSLPTSSTSTSTSISAASASAGSVSFAPTQAMRDGEEEEQGEEERGERPTECGRPTDWGYDTASSGSDDEEGAG